MKIDTNAILLDTNILTAYWQANHERHVEVRTTIQRLWIQEHHLLLAPQCLYEFYNVATRPYKQNGLNLTPEKAAALVFEIEAIFGVVDAIQPLALYALWLELVQTYRVSGKTAHDARLVAWMLGNGVPNLLTLNPVDFMRYDGRITLVAV